jgi:hypothetical protein
MSLIGPSAYGGTAAPRATSPESPVSIVPHNRLLAFGLTQQLRQTRDVDGDPLRLILREHLGLRGFIVVAG